ncbi:uncharacterized protein LOC126786629 isoform X2 [Argentina anserina]|uniref:uncharacterized protein LOC126786629 isoform X2 n=1 Tax=Argentina anserina TaxID=57926 RepID=UPI0021762E04|nr:uncharacterized protein LOC126786629 isoform X2 [Potentilla anserina]
MEPTPIRNLVPFQFNFRIRVRASRVWRPRKFNSKDYDGLHYVLVDQMGDGIHGMIVENVCARVHNRMEEGQIYDVFCFSTQRDAARYKVMQHGTILLFNARTQLVIVPETFPPIPQHSFHLLEYSQLEEEVDHQEVLADIYGCIKEVIPERSIYVKSEKKVESICEIDIQNLREELRITLWGDPARSFPLGFVQNSGTPVFAVFTSLRLSKFKDHIKASSTNHTCIIINPVVPEREHYEHEFTRPGDMARIIPIPVRYQQNEEQRQHIQMSLSELNALNPEAYVRDTVLCAANIIAFDNTLWWYKGCPKSNCLKQLKKREEDGGYMCAAHTDEVHEPLPCYMIRMTVDDGDNEATMTVLGKQAEQLFNATCQDLLSKRFYATETDLPEEITQTIGQNHIFEIKVNFNRELVVKAVLPNPQAVLNPTDELPIPITAPDDTHWARKRGRETSETTLFSSEAGKKTKREGDHGASSSSTGRKLGKEKMN